MIVPTRNRQQKLAMCLDGLSRQTHGSCEVIVIDDGSTDGTTQTVADRQQAFGEDRLRLLQNDEPRGANASRNRGIRESRGRLIAFIDDDCIPDVDWLEHLAAGFTSDSVAAVVGLVENVPSRNLFELMLRGTQRVYGTVRATRLVGCNMAVRRDLLDRFMLDEDRAGPSSDMSVSGRGDEEGLFIELQRAGFEQHVVPQARVLHDHPHNGRSFCKQAYRSGVSSARLAKKYRLPFRIELSCLLLAWCGLVAGFLAHWIWSLAAVAFGLFLGAVSYNEVVRKKKTLVELVRIFPLMLLYYHLRMYGYWREMLSGKRPSRPLPAGPGDSARTSS